MPPTSTVPQAAARRPYSASTLRNYIRAWEELYGALPRSRRGNSVQLVDSLLDIFDSAYESGVGRLAAIKDRLAEALLEEPTALPRVATAYSTLLGSEDLIGVEHTTSRLQAHCLVSLAARLQDVAGQSPGISRLEASLNKELSWLYKNLAALIEGQVHYAKQAVDATSDYIANLESDRQISLEVAQSYGGTSERASGGE